MIGDQNDVAGRVWRLLPAGWFGRRGDSPIIEAIAQGIGSALSAIYSLYTGAKALTRLATLYGGWLELAANDFLGQFPRLGNESDASYGRRIRLEILRPRNTRNAIDRAVYDLTGNHPDIFEGWRPGDCAAYGVPTSAYGVSGSRYGTLGAPFLVTITASAPQNYGIPNIPGYGNPQSAYGISAQGFRYADNQDLAGSGATYLDVLAELERVRTAGVTYLVQFTAGSGGALDFSTPDDTGLFPAL